MRDKDSSSILQSIEDFEHANKGWIESLKSRTKEDLQKERASLSEAWLNDVNSHLDSVFDTYIRPLHFPDSIASDLLQDFEKIKELASECSDKAVGTILFESTLSELFRPIIEKVNKHRISSFNFLAEGLLALPQQERKHLIAKIIYGLNNIKREKSIFEKAMTRWEEYAIEWIRDLKELSDTKFENNYYPIFRDGDGSQITRVLVQAVIDDERNEALKLFMLNISTQPVRLNRSAVEFIRVLSKIQRLGAIKMTRDQLETYIFDHILQNDGSRIAKSTIHDSLKRPGLRVKFSGIYKPLNYLLEK